MISTTMESTHQRFPLPVAHRRSLHESCYFTHLHKSLRFHLASPLDLDQLYTYLSTVHKLLKYEDLKKIKNALSQGWLILSSDFFEVCGMLAGRVVVGDTSGKTLHIEWTGVYDVYEKDNLLERQLLIEAFKYAFQQEIVQIFYKPQNEQLRKVAENVSF
ncbi:hypothetical protein M3Y97_00685500 [Aphelenchoides bicaudatus]|nr:hypothetical protein M3Y97_00685500 [Aphelenchoides bicaudatus]